MIAQVRQESADIGTDLNSQQYILLHKRLWKLLDKQTNFAEHEAPL